MKLLTFHRLMGFFASLEEEWDVRLPIRLPDGSRALGSLADGPPSLQGGPLPAKPTALFFPQEEPLFTATDQGMHSPSPPDRPLLVAGLPPRDLACLGFMDRFFSAPPRDDLYFNRRQGALIVGLSGRCGP